MRTIWVCVAGAIILGGGYYAFRGNGASPVTYQAQAIDRGDIVISISATGTLNAVTTVQVGSQVSGTIAKLYADFNSEVKDGQLLAQLDPTFLQATVSEQSANVERAVAQRNEAKRNMNRTNELLAKSLISQVESDAATTALETAEASLKQAEASLQRAKVNLRYATILAPIDGVVISRNVDVGQTVAASLSAPTLFTIANDLRKMQVQASVDEADIGQVKMGQQVTFRVDAFPNDKFSGTLSQVRLAPIISQNVVTYNVIIDVDNANLKLMPGMTATVTVEVARHDNVLRAPIQAIQFVPPMGKEGGEGRMQGERKDGDRLGGARAADSTGIRHQPRDIADKVTLWILESGTPKAIFASKGIQNARWVELIESTLNEGDSVLVSSTGGQAQSTPQGTNPFMPRMPGGGSGGRGSRGN
ncbi:MAG: efflux RND transporter periplasmic adaptor subunit [Candidatus Zixiibacteriota bacterium]